MSLKFALVLAPVALGGWWFARASDPASHFSDAECVALQRRLAEGLYADPAPNNAAALRRLRGLSMEMDSHGCRSGLGEPVDVSRIARDPEPTGDSSRIRLANPPPGDPPAPVASFAPGRPMVDVSRNRPR